jgi:CHAT domain-containing protein
MTGSRLTSTAKKHGPCAALILLTPVVLVGGYLWWTGEIRFVEPSVAPGRQYSPDPPSAPPHREPPVIWQGDLEQQLEHLRLDVARLRADDGVPETTLCTVLLQLGDLERAIGDADAGEAALREVVGLCRDDSHWRAREALRRLNDLSTLAERGPADQKLWRESFQKQRKAEALHAQGKFRDGVSSAEEALRLRRELWGRSHAGEHAEVAESLLRLAWLCTEQADFYLRSRELAREAAQATREAVGVSHPAYGDCLFVLAALADDRGEFNDADRLYNESLAVLRDSVGELSRAYARALNRQGRMYETWWKEFAGAKLLRAQYIRQQMLEENDPDRAESLEEQAEVLYTQRHFEWARRLLDEALTIRRESQGETHPHIARTKCLLGACLALCGDSSQAIVETHDALALSEGARGANHPIALEERLLYAVVKRAGMCDYVGAYHEAQQARQGYLALGLQGHPNYCAAILGQADALRTEIIRVRDIEMLDESDLLSLLSSAIAKYQEALDSYRAIPGGEKIGGCIEAIYFLCDHHYVANYATLDREGVRKLLADAERIMMKNGGELHGAYPGLSYHRGRLFQSQGRYDKSIPLAQEHLKRVLDRTGRTDPWGYYHALRNLGGSLLHEGTNPALARQHLQECFEVNFGLFRNDGPGQNGSARLMMLSDCFLAQGAVLSAAAMQDDLTSLYDAVLALKGRASSFQIADRLAHDHPELKVWRDAARDARRVLKETAFSGNPSDGDWTGRVLAAADGKELAESRLALATRRHLLAESDVTWAQLQSELPPRTAFVDFLTYCRSSSPPGHQGRLVLDLRMLAFVVGNAGSPVCVDLGPCRPIQSAVSAWRRGIGEYQRKRHVNFKGRTERLAKLVWTPLQQHLQNVDSLVIAPDGPVCFVSFAALPGRRPGTYALEDYQITYANSGHWLHRQLQNQARPTGEGLLLCGDIQYRPLIARKVSRQPSDGPSADLLPDAERIPNLPASKYEIEAVRTLFSARFDDAQGIVTLNGDQATVLKLEAELERNWRCLHFAGHGLFVPPSGAAFLTGHHQDFFGLVQRDQDSADRHVPARPSHDQGNSYFVQRNQLLLSALVLAPALVGDRKPGILTAEDLGSRDQRQTDLVVLSGCETGAGCTAGGDGVLGLTRAFLTAGARTVISSLWKVDDAATTHLMTEFYRNLWERGLPKSEALRQAQLAVMRNPSLIDGVREKLFAQLQRSLPSLGVDELSDEMAQNGRGLLAGVLADAAANESGDDESEGDDIDPSLSSRAPPALWAAFILNGDAR